MQYTQGSIATQRNQYQSIQHNTHLLIYHSRGAETLSPLIVQCELAMDRVRVIQSSTQADMSAESALPTCKCRRWQRQQEVTHVRSSKAQEIKWPASPLTGRASRPPPYPWSLPAFSFLPAHYYKLNIHTCLYPACWIEQRALCSTLAQGRDLSHATTSNDRPFRGNLLS